MSRQMPRRSASLRDSSPNDQTSSSEMTYNSPAWATAKWTKEEEDRLLKLRAAYAKYTWLEFEKFGFFPGRSTGAIKSKWHALRDETSEPRASHLENRPFRAARKTVPSRHSIEENLGIPDPRPGKRPAILTKKRRVGEIHAAHDRNIEATPANHTGSECESIENGNSNMRIYDSGGMTDPEASDDPGDIEFDGSTRRLSRGPRSQGNNGTPSRRSQTTTSPSQTPSTRPPPISHPARWCWESVSPRPSLRYPSPAIKSLEVDNCESSVGASAQSEEGMEKAYNASKVLRRLLDIDSTCGPSCPPPVPAIHAGQPARISFQIPAPGASSSERKTIASSTSVFQNPLEKPTTASTTNPTNLNPLHSPALSTRRSSPPANSAEKANQEPTTTANIEESTSEKPAPNTRCLIDAVEKVVQCARVLDHNNQSRTKREVELQTETTALRQITKSLGVSLRDTKTKCEKLECEMMSLAEEVRALKRDLEAVRGQQELLREFVVQMIAVLLNKTCTTGSV